MPERDGYIPGVPCWVDMGHPDPDPWSRLTIINDPQGATFIASQFVSENKISASRRTPGPSGWC